MMAIEKNSEDILYTTQMNEHIRSSLNDLPDNQRQIIHLSYINNMTQSEIAKHVSLPLGTVKSRMRLAYAKLKTTLHDLK